MRHLSTAEKYFVSCFIEKCNEVLLPTLGSTMSLYTFLDGTNESIKQQQKQVEVDDPFLARVLFEISYRVDDENFYDAKIIELEKHGYSRSSHFIKTFRSVSEWLWLVESDGVRKKVLQDKFKKENESEQKKFNFENVAQSIRENSVSSSKILQILDQAEYLGLNKSEIDFFKLSYENKLNYEKENGLIEKIYTIDDKGGVNFNKKKALPDWEKLYISSNPNSFFIKPQKVEKSLYKKQNNKALNANKNTFTKTSKYILDKAVGFGNIRLDNESIVSSLAKSLKKPRSYFPTLGWGFHITSQNDYSIISDRFLYLVRKYKILYKGKVKGIHFLSLYECYVYFNDKIQLVKIEGNKLKIINEKFSPPLDKQDVKIKIENTNKYFFCTRCDTPFQTPVDKLKIICPCCGGDTDINTRVKS